MDELSESRKQELRDELQAYVKLDLGIQYLAGLPEHGHAYLEQWATEFVQAMLKQVIPVWDALVVWMAEIAEIIRPMIEKLADWCIKYCPRLMHKPYGVTPMPRWLRATVRIRPILRLDRLGVDSG